MEETVTAAIASGVQQWQEKSVEAAQLWHGRAVSSAEKWLDYAASIDVTAGTSTKHISWTDEWEQFKSFFEAWSDKSRYWQIMNDAFHDAIKGIQSVAYFLWITIQPFFYSITYIMWRTAQTVLGKLLPTLQHASIEFCRFHLHLTWRQALGEFALILALWGTWKFVKYLQKKKYVQRSRKFIQQKAQQITKAVQAAYREVAHVSLLFAMSLPHILFFSVTAILTTLFPNWMSWVATETITTSLFKWWYPLAATIVVLHHARAFPTTDSGALDDDDDDDDEDDNGQPSTVQGKKRQKKKEDNATTEQKEKKKAKKRRRSSIGALLHRTAPGRITETQQPGGGVAAELFVYSEEELHEDVNYWLHYWVLYGSSQAIYSLATRIIFLRSLLANARVDTIISELELIFYIWIFLLPQCLLVLFPSSDEEERREWSSAKQWCYECALQPVLAIPTLYKPVVIPLFEKVSTAISSRFWRRHVVNRAKPFLDMAVFVRIISETSRDTILDTAQNFNKLVVPALTLFSPGFITQYGVWYVQYVVPQAYSLRALHRQHRHSQRVLYLKFWILHGMADTLISRLVSVFWWVPFSTHFSFIVWTVLVMPRVTKALYYEFDRELQAFGFLPPVEGDLAVEDTHTVRALSFIASKLPSAVASVDEKATTTSADDEKATKEKGGKAQSGGSEDKSKEKSSGKVKANDTTNADKGDKADKSDGVSKKSDNISVSNDGEDKERNVSASKKEARSQAETKKQSKAKDEDTNVISPAVELEDTEPTKATIADTSNSVRRSSRIGNKVSS